MLALACCAIACDQAAHDTLQTVPSVELVSSAQVEAMSDHQLIAKRDAWVALAREAQTADALTAARNVGAIARTLTRRTADVSHVQMASALLAQIGQQHVGAQACEALLDRVRLHLVELADVVEAERQARAILTRHADESGTGACLAATQRVIDALSDHPAVVQAAVAQARKPQTAASPAAGLAPDRDSSGTWVQTSALPAAAAPATLERVTVYGGRAGTRVVRAVLYFDRPVQYRGGEAVSEAGLPRRLFLDFDAIKVATSVQPTATIALAGLQRIRVLSLDNRDVDATHNNPGRTRVSFDVDAAVAHRAFFLNDPYRVVVDLQVREAEPLLNAKVRTIVLDPGHGGRNLGAHGPHGLREAVVALDLSRRVRALLRTELPGTRVVLTRETNEDLSLEERTAIANGENAQLFVSIHLNAWATPDQGGVATFVLDTSDDSQALRLAARENGTEVTQVNELQKVLAGLYRKEQVAQSLQLAESIHHQTLQAGRAILPALVDRGVKRAMFYVLVGATMPAVLVEPSFITHPDEAQALTTDAYRDRLAAGIALGIAKYARSL